jgi:hypothetical protein
MGRSVGKVEGVEKRGGLWKNDQEPNPNDQGNHQYKNSQ